MNRTVQQAASKGKGNNFISARIKTCNSRGNFADLRLYGC